MDAALISPQRRQRGFSLIEALIALVLVGIVASALSRSLVDSRVVLSNDQARNQANYKASRLIDSLSATGLGGVENGSRELVCADAGDHVEFVCRVEVNPQSYAITGRVASKRVAVDVEWKIRKAPHSIHMEGVIE